MGGIVALELARSHPTVVQALVLSGTVARQDAAGSLTFAAWAGVARACGVGSYELAGLVTRDAFSRRFISHAGGLQELVEMVRSTLRDDYPLKTFVDACDVLQRVRADRFLGKISVPTLVLVGQNDTITPLQPAPPGVGAGQISEMLPRGRLQVLEDCGHANLTEKPTESAQAILDFVLTDARESQERR
jgi:pimeloyl-ACP methyl ester carboxylesterase